MNAGRIHVPVQAPPYGQRTAFRLGDPASAGTGARGFRYGEDDIRFKAMGIEYEGDRWTALGLATLGVVAAFAMR